MGDLIDKGLAVGASFDWISPMISIIGGVINGPSHTFLIPHGSCPMSGKEVARTLRRRGVRCWGLMIVSGTLMVSVKLNQARWAQHLLEQAGVPVENPLPAGRPARKTPGRVDRRGSMVKRSRILREMGRR